MPPHESTYTFPDFVGAWRSSRRWQHAHPDLATYHLDRYRAFARTFGVDLSDLPDQAPPVPKWLADTYRVRRAECGENVDWSDDPMWTRNVHDFVLMVEEKAQRTTDPWSGFMEAPEPIIAIYGRYGERIKKSTERARDDLLAMSTDLLALIYPAAADKTVTEFELRAAGFDPQRDEPEPLDYW